MPTRSNKGRAADFELSSQYLQELCTTSVSPELVEIATDYSSDFNEWCVWLGDDIHDKIDEMLHGRDEYVTDSFQIWKEEEQEVARANMAETNKILSNIDVEFESAIKEAAEKEFAL